MNQNNKTDWNVIHQTQLQIVYICFHTQLLPNTQVYKKLGLFRGYARVVLQFLI